MTLSSTWHVTAPPKPTNAQSPTNEGPSGAALDSITAAAAWRLLIRLPYEHKMAVRKCDRRCGLLRQMFQAAVGNKSGRCDSPSRPGEWKVLYAELVEVIPTYYSTLVTPPAKRFLRRGTSRRARPVSYTYLLLHTKYFSYFVDHQGAGCVGVCLARLPFPCRMRGSKPARLTEVVLTSYVSRCVV